jgi:hypothetical protein
MVVVTRRYRVTVEMGILIRGPIPPATFSIGRTTVGVSYPETVRLLGDDRPFPRAAATVFEVKWIANDSTRSGSVRRHAADEAIERALASVNKLLIAYKLAKLNSLDTKHVRTVGHGDMIFWRADVIDEEERNASRTSGASMVMYHFTSTSVHDPELATFAAIAHLSGRTRPIPRRIVRAFELVQQGFYTEAVIVAYALLDDQLQRLLGKLLIMQGKSVSLLRDIKEQRLQTYLGSFLTELTGKPITAEWPEANFAIRFMRGQRNKASHEGYQADKDAASLVIYGVVRMLLALEAYGLATEIDHEMHYYAYHNASIVRDRQRWVPPEPPQAPRTS